MTEPPDPLPVEHRDAYERAVLKVIEFYSPCCSHYQVWRGIFGTPLDLQYPKALYPALERMIAKRLISADEHPDYPNGVYAITDSGRAILSPP